MRGFDADRGSAPGGGAARDVAGERTAPIRVLVVEDDPDDAALVVEELRRAGLELEWRRAGTPGELEAALEAGPWDVALLDYGLPGFTGTEALALIRERDPDVPVIMVSGTVGEEVAVAMMRIGASDFFLKGRLRLLPAAVERELRQAANRRAKREAERRLAESEARYRRFFQADISGDYLVSVDGRILECNPTLVEMLGFENPDELRSADLEELYVGPESREDFLERLRRERAIRRREVRYRRKDGRVITVLESAFGIFGDDGRLEEIMGMMVDVTELREVREQLLHAQRMESVGRLAGGVAHDLNNILQLIHNNLDLLGRETLETRVLRRFAAIAGAAERASDLTRQLLAFSRRQVLELRPVELGALVEGLLKMLRRLIGEHIRLETVAAGGELPVVVDPGQIEQVLMNLVVNARDAMPGGGTITITLGRRPADAGFLASRPWAEAGSYAVVKVADTGPGIPEEIRSRIFEPFFTTKEEGKGTGLGLSTAYGIATQHGGMLEVESEPGRGSTFTLYLPLTPAVGSEEEEPAGPPPPGHGELLLVAEDDPLVRDVLREILTEGGYRVELAADGEEALRLFARDPESFAVVLLDVLMPRLSGPETAERMRRLRPGLTVVFASGYDDETLAEQGSLGEHDLLLRKPFRQADVLRVLHRALGGG